ncbi:WD40 repeat domain-containing protein [Geminocystis sp. CENA526]|uniref:WD40 repeat domain-containing protein n=1 Tax=Geminocystis sp. CENA526 TaxID=1355871 RepID=UPI003D6EC884
MTFLSVKFLVEKRVQLEEYITALSWSKDDTLAISSAGGEVMVIKDEPKLILLGNAQQNSIHCLDFSPDGQFLAGGGQDGQVRIWDRSNLQLIDTLNWGKQWVEKLAWHPQENYLAFSQGRYVQIWDVNSQEIIVTLLFENSSVLDLAWNPNGQLLAIAGNGGVKIWDTQNWDDDPFFIETNAAALKIAWSPDGEYLAVSSLDKIIFLWGGGNLVPWQLSGFQGKIRNLTWSNICLDDTPILATSTKKDIILWEKNDQQGWNASVLKSHNGIIKNLEFHPQSLLLLSGCSEGNLSFWENARTLTQNIKEISGGFSKLLWNTSGYKLAIGSDRGEIVIFRVC